MAASHLVESYEYDESGNRIATITPTQSTWYVYDAGGNALAIYSGSTTPALAEVPVYGSSRLGTYYTSGSHYVYEIRDNVGSVREVINGAKAGTSAATYAYTDYYPFGQTARSDGSNYRYAYQGAYAENDANTGLDNFKLRMYDSRIGRWLTTDPAGQYASPYEGMGNNPITGSDPTGGLDSLNYDTNSGTISRIPTNDGKDYFSVNNIYQGWAYTGQGGLNWSWNKTVSNVPGEQPKTSTISNIVSWGNFYTTSEGLNKTGEVVDDLAWAADFHNEAIAGGTLAAKLLETASPALDAAGKYSAYLGAGLAVTSAAIHAYQGKYSRADTRALIFAGAGVVLAVMFPEAAILGIVVATVQLAWDTSDVIEEHNKEALPSPTSDKPKLLLNLKTP